MSSLAVWVGVGVLGGAGAVARFVVDDVVSARTGRGFPYGILVVNLSGAFALGLLVGAGTRGDALLLAGAATIGSYTTFSTWMLESHRPWVQGRRRVAAANLIVSLAAGLLLAALGRLLGQAL